MDTQSLFNRDFYPTPDEVISRMLAFSDIAGKIILEPSAGQGNIVDFLKVNGAKKIIACELNDKLRKVVSGKCDVVCSDLMELNADQISHIDMIVMNPPFSKAAEHILHAWEIAPDGCEIVSLCNSEMLRNTYFSTTRRKVEELIKTYGGDEYLGDVFKQAERVTDAHVSVVRLYKPQKEGLEFSSYFTNEADDPEFAGNGLIRYDFVRDCVNRFVMAVSKFDAAMEANNEINNLTKGIGGCRVKFGAWTDNNAEVTRDYFKKELQKSAWKWLFHKFSLDKFTTTKVMEEINKFVELQTNVPFTMKNIYRMVSMIYASREEIIKQALNDAFDIICSYSADNSTAGETWKTNKNYMVNRKFIVPYICDIRFGGYMSISWGSTSTKMNDIHKVLCFLTGTLYDRTQDLDSFVYKQNLSFGELYEWGFFKIRGYKKGTMHFEFIDEDLWYKFNSMVAKSRGWELPQNTGKKKKQ